MSSNLDTLYRQVIMDHYKKPRNKGMLETSDFAIDMVNPSCGDKIQLHLKVKDGIIEDAKFTGEGCSISLASASMMTVAIKGATFEEAIKRSKLFSEMMQGNEIDEDEWDMGDVEALSGVAKFPARIKCATLCWKAMEQTLAPSGQSED